MSIGVRNKDQEKQTSKKRNDSKPGFTNTCRRARAKQRNSKNYFFRKRAKNSYNKYTYIYIYIR